MITLDTSVIVDWLTCAEADLPEKSLELRDGPNPLHWDEYTRQQFRNVFIRACVLAYNNLHRYQSVARAANQCLRFTKVGESERGGGTPGRIAQFILTMLASRYETSDPYITVQQVLDFVLEDLEGYLGGELERLLSVWITVHTDLMGCVYADGMPALEDEYFSFRPRPSCNQKHPRSCSIETFWDLRISNLASLGESIQTATTPEHKKIAKAASTCSLNTSKARGQNCLAPLSDLVIYLSAAHTGTVATTNVQDFKFIRKNAVDKYKVLPIHACGQEGN